MSYKLLIITFIILISSCQNNNTLNYENYSRRIVSDEVYDMIFKQATDSIDNWVNNELSLFTFKKYNRGFLLDRLICFNNSKDKFVGALLINHNKSENATLDDIWFIYGAKIKDTWYFFQGADITLPREFYQKDVRKPLSFEKLHEIALEEVFRGYLKEKTLEPRYAFWKSREYEVNEDFFKQVESQGIDGTYAGCRTFEEKVLFLVKKNWGIYEPCNYKLITITDKKNNAYFDFVDSLDFVDLQKKGYVDSAGNLLKFYKRHCQNSDYLNEHYPRQH